MNKIHITPWLLTLFISIGFLACDVEGLEGQFGEVIEEEEIEDPNENAVFEAEFDGQLFVATSIVAFMGETGLTIEASNGIQKCVVLLPNPFVNNFSLNPASGQAYFSYQPSLPAPTGGEIFISEMGSFNVTNFSDEVNIISGNFSGELLEAVNQSANVQMTNGVFQNIFFFNENEVEPTEPDATFMTASIDQVFFNASTISFVGNNQTGTVTGNEANRTIELSFVLTEGTGDYTLSTEGFSATYSIDGNPQETTEGTITLTEVSANYIGGNFEFVTAEATVQSGVFGVNTN